MKFLLFSLALVFANSSMAQYQIGHRTVDFNDPSRARTITCEIYYPGITAGDDVTCAVGTFPLIVFGHGFAMGYDAYLNFTDTLIPHGYIMVLPTTETGMSPDHEAFGLDLKFVNNDIKTQAASTSSFFLYNHLSGTSAIAGHSMGGGASFLAAAGNSNLTALINFAAAETTPSSISAAATATVPTLIFQGENDGVAPPDEHQIPMYNALSLCKYKINILGGGHCYFGNSNALCSAAELFTSPQPTITREEQHKIQFDMLIPFLEWQLKGNGAMKNVFEDSIQNSSRVNAIFNCSQTFLEEPSDYIAISPNPASENLDVCFFNNSKAIVSMLDLTGAEILRVETSNAKMSLDAKQFSNGLYFLHIQRNGKTIVRKVLIQHN